MRMHRECLNPKAVATVEAVEGAVMKWEDKWRRMVKETGGEH